MDVQQNHLVPNLSALGISVHQPHPQSILHPQRPSDSILFTQSSQQNQSNQRSKSGSIQSAQSTHQQPGSASSDNQQPFSRFVSSTLCTEQRQGTSVASASRNCQRQSDIAQVNPDTQWSKVVQSTSSIQPISIQSTSSNQCQSGFVLSHSAVQQSTLPSVQSVSVSQQMLSTCIPSTQLHKQPEPVPAISSIKPNMLLPLLSTSICQQSSVPSIYQSSSTDPDFLLSLLATLISHNQRSSLLTKPQQKHSRSVSSVLSTQLNLPISVLSTCVAQQNSSGSASSTPRPVTTQMSLPVPVLSTSAGICATKAI